MKSSVLLGVNIDHVATLRQARGSRYPDPVFAAMQAELAGADGITLHLREDRRHIQDQDVWRMKDSLQTRMNLEMAVTNEMLGIAMEVKPEHCCLVPEKREEVTTEGGLDVLGQEARIAEACAKLAEENIEVSLFIDPDPKQISAAKRCGAPVVELHTGCYADANGKKQLEHEFQVVSDAVSFGLSEGLIVNAGHGLHYHNVTPIAAIPGINELNIGHSIICHALYVGFDQAVKEMVDLINLASLSS